MSAHLKMGSNTEQVHLLGQTEQCMMANGLITSVGKGHYVWANR